jgi:hypothetical protein
VFFRKAFLQGGLGQIGAKGLQALAIEPGEAVEVCT